MMNYLLATLFILWVFPAQAASWLENRAIGELFKNTGVQGTFVLYDVASQTNIGHDEVRANRRFVPASTFKIPHTLIGLSTGVVKNVDEPLPYRGPAEPFVKAWARDMGLREAMALSNVPIYQQLARCLAHGELFLP